MMATKGATQPQRMTCAIQRGPPRRENASTSEKTSPRHTSAIIASIMW